MDVTALYIQMLMNVFILLAAQDEHGYFAQKADAASLHISPERLQFFMYESITISCEEIDSVTGWKVMRNLLKRSPADSPEACNATTPPCRISPALVSLSGNYWCENEQGEKSNAVNISVTDGSVILVIPTRPVMEGSDVIFDCLENGNKSSIVDFYKDGQCFDTQYSGPKTIKNVTKSDEGLYKCGISGSGDSPESWLAVSKPDTAPYEDTFVHDSGITLILRCTVTLVTLLVAATALLLFWKRKVGKEDTEIDPNHATYAVVNKQRQRKDGDKDDPERCSYAAIKKKKKDPVLLTVNMEPYSEEDVIYSSINCVQV